MVVFFPTMPPSTPPPTDLPRESPFNRRSASYATSGEFDRDASYARFFSPSSLEYPNEHPQTPVVEPWIARDMEKQQSADVAALVGAFLSISSDIPRSPVQNAMEFAKCRDTISSM